MKKIDDVGLKLCAMQGEIFKVSLDKAPCSSAVFIRRFMNSALAERMDSGGFLFESCDVNSAIAEIEQEYGISNYGKEKYAGEELYWIGYAYRYWAYTREISSKSIYRKINSREMRKLYFPYHSLDPSQAIERILETNGIPEIDQITKGVEILRGLLKKNKNHK